MIFFFSLIKAALFVVTCVHTICLHFYLLCNVSLQLFEHNVFTEISTFMLKYRLKVRPL